MDSYAFVRCLKPALALLQEAAQSAPQVSASITPQDIPPPATRADALTRWQTYAIFIQTVAFIIQAFAALIIIRTTRRAAREGAERAYELSKRETLEREERERGQQRKSLRLLLALELRKNLIDLNWLLKETLGNITAGQGTPDGGLSTPACSAADYLSQLTMFMPEWSHRAWYGQQSSPMLTSALDPREIRAVNYIHSLFERLSQIKKLCSDSLRQFDAEAVSDSEQPSSLDIVAQRLWSDFESVVEDIKKIVNARDIEKIEDLEEISDIKEIIRMDIMSGNGLKIADETDHRAPLAGI